MNKKFDLYCELSHRLAFEQLVERFCFEMEANILFFDCEEMPLESLIGECSNHEVFSDSEYKLAYNKSKMLLSKRK